MKLAIRKPGQSLSKAYAKQSVGQDQIDAFCRALERLFSRLDENETEEHQKNIVASFLNESFYGNAPLWGRTFEINTRERIDLAIHSGPTAETPVGVVLETKRVRSNEMMTALTPNVKALHELILYYFEEREKHANVAISQLVATDVYNWFLFDENDFRRVFYDNTKLRKLYDIKRQQKKDNPFFYAETARILREMDDELPVTVLNLRDAHDAIRGLNRPDTAEAASRILIPVFKLFSPEHLLKLPFANDANTLNQGFYHELLHILGLHEVANGGQKFIERLPVGHRFDGSLLENTINILRVDGILDDLPTRDDYGTATDEQLTGVALELCITWLNRVLFLKLLEGQLGRYSPGGARFMAPASLREFDDLNELFFEVLAVPEHSRAEGIMNRYGPIPYLNSSLFEITALERKAVKINELKDRLELPLSAKTVLRDQHGKRRTGQLPTLNYLLGFLDAYDFATDGPAEIQPDNKTLINAAVLGLIFEKLNGYRDGSFFTPGFITMFMVRDVLHRAVIARFNEQYGWTCQTVNDVYNKLDRVDIRQANAIINGLRICDPAVGSGHFLVSALNELIALKAQLGILCDSDGRRIRHQITIENDELIVTDEDGQPFQYRAPIAVSPPPSFRGAGGEGYRPTEMQRVQETLFHEKQTIIENCLFGVDINPNSVNICRLRLWIELLKCAYFRVESQKSKVEGRKSKVENLDTENDFRPSTFDLQTTLQTLPNLDINIKVGNSLVGQTDVGAGFEVMTPRLEQAIAEYRQWVQDYKHASDKELKRGIRKRIEDIQGVFANHLTTADKGLKIRLDKLTAEFIQKYQTQQLFGDALTPAQLKERQKLQTALDTLAVDLDAARNNPIYNRAFEWRYAFPEVMDDAGQFAGFDVVVGNPPYIRHELIAPLKPHLQKTYPNVAAGTADLYVYFVELGMNILRDGGYFSYIIPNKWMRAGYGAGLRRWLKTLTITRITDFGDLPVFDEATTYPSILTLQKPVASGQWQVASDVKLRVTNEEPGQELTTNHLPLTTMKAALVQTLDFSHVNGNGLADYLADRTFEMALDALPDNGWTLSDATTQTLLAKLRAAGKPLREYVNDKIYRGVLTGLNEAFVIDEPTRARLVAQDARSAEVIKPFLAGRDIKRYQTPVADKFLIFTRRGINIEEYPAILAHLEQFKDRLVPKPRDHKGAWAGRKEGRYRWYEIQDAVDYYPEFDNPKLMLPDIAIRGQFIYDNAGAYCTNTAYIIPVDDKYLMAVLNSSPVLFFYSNLTSTIRGGYLRFIRQYLEQIPIPEASLAVQADLSARVEEILTLKRADDKADTSAQEAAIDLIVCGLYGIRAEEIP